MWRRRDRAQRGDIDGEAMTAPAMPAPNLMVAEVRKPP